MTSLRSRRWADQAGAGISSASATSRRTASRAQRHRSVPHLLPSPAPPLRRPLSSQTLPFSTQEPICPCCRTEFELIELIDTASLRDVAEGRREEPETRMVPVPAGKISENAEGAAQRCATGPRWVGDSLRIPITRCRCLQRRMAAWTPGSGTSPCAARCASDRTRKTAWCCAMGATEGTTSTAWTLHGRACPEGTGTAPPVKVSTGGATLPGWSSPGPYTLPGGARARPGHLRQRRAAPPAELREQYLAYERDLDRQYAERRAGRSGARGTSGGQRRGSAAGGGQRGRARLRRTSRRESDGSASDDSFVVPDSDLEDSDEGSVQFVSSSGDSSDESSGEGPLEEEVGGRGRRAGEERGQEGAPGTGTWSGVRRDGPPVGAGGGVRAPLPSSG